MNPSEVVFAGPLRLRQLLAEGSLDASQLMSIYLERIERINPRLNAFASLRAAEALEEAGQAQHALDNGDTRPLLGIPFAVKDEHDVAGQVTSYGTAACTAVAKQDAPFVSILRQAGAIPIGKTTLPELGMHPFTESARFGVTRNPWNPSRTPGGSSGGSAAAVAAGLVPFATGGDGGGSIRIPASCCNLFGLKVQRGRVPESMDLSAGSPGLLDRLSVLGVLTRGVADAALLYDVLISGSGGPGLGLSEAARQAPKPLKIGVAFQAGTPARTRQDVREGVDHVARTLANLGHELTPVTIEPGPWSAPFSLIGLGMLGQIAQVVEDRSLLEPRTLAALRLATRVPDSMVKWGMRRQDALTRRNHRLFDQVDLVLTPTLALPPPPVAQWAGKGLLRTYAGVGRWCPFTALWNFLGFPAANVPAGFNAAGLPIGAQLLGPPDDEPTLIAVSAELERELRWTDRRPDV